MRDSALALYECVKDDLSAVIGAELTSWLACNDYAPDMTPREVAARQMLVSFLKKYQGESTAKADDAALEKFLATNNRCGEWVLSLESSWDEVLVGTFKQVLYEFFYPKGQPLIGSFREMFARGRVGPGASVGARGGDFYTKLFDSPLSTTGRFLYDEYRRYISSVPTWHEAELARIARWGDANVTDTSRLCFVPKNADISRVIFVEPALNMFCQLGLEDLLRQRLNQFFWLDLEVQQYRNRELARRGSVDGSYSTIDLSSASDSIALKMLHEVMPANVLAWFLLLRTKYAECRGERVELQMISTMGNGFTFPLQTILFAAIVEACSRCSGDRAPFTKVEIKSKNSRGDKFLNYGVNGDDIICPTLLTKDVLRLLTILGFEVNSSKTFLEGSFRESCGGDYFQGHFVRGVYVKTLAKPQDRFAVINQLNHWSARTGISMSRTVQNLLRKVPKNWVPFAENDDAGIKVPKELLTSANLRYDRKVKSIMYRRHLKVASRIKITDAELIVPRGMRRRTYNPSGLLLAFLNGSVVGESISVRSDAGRYTTKLAVTPFWDWVNPDPQATPMLSDAGGIAPSDYWQRWETAVSYNLYG